MFPRPRNLHARAVRSKVDQGGQIGPDFRQVPDTHSYWFMQQLPYEHTLPAVVHVAPSMSSASGQPSMRGGGFGVQVHVGFQSGPGGGPPQYAGQVHEPSA